jgi:hypothetical protein
MESRRKFLQKALYTAPLVLTMAVRPSHAGSGYTGGVLPGNGGGGGGSNISTTPSGGLGGGTQHHHSGGSDSAPWWEFWRHV